MRSPAEKPHPPPQRRDADHSGCRLPLGGVAVTNAGASSVSALKSKIDAAHSQADPLGAQISTRARRSSRRRGPRPRAAAARESQLTALLAIGEQRAAALQAQVNQARVGLERARAQLRRALGALSDRLVAIYEAGSADPIELLLSSRGFDDLANRAELLARVQRADNALAMRVRILKHAVAARLASVSAAHARAVVYNEQVAAARTQISAVRAHAEATAASLAAARQQAQSCAHEPQSQVSDWQHQVEAAQQVSAQQAQSTVTNWIGKWAIPEAIVMCESSGRLPCGQPELRGRRRVPDHALDLAPVRPVGAAGERLARAPEPHRRANLGRFRPRRVAVLGDGRRLGRLVVRA